MVQHYHQPSTTQTCLPKQKSFSLALHISTMPEEYVSHTPATFHMDGGSNTIFASQVEESYEQESYEYTEEDQNGDVYEFEETETYQEEEVIYED